MREKKGKRSAIEAAMTFYLDSGCERDLEAVFVASQGLVYHFARLFSPENPTEDMLQAGHEGLMKAVKRFDPAAGASFITYAGHCIMGEIRHHIRKENAYYHPGCIADLQSRVDQLIAEHLKRHGDVPPIAVIAAQLNVKEEAVTEVMRAGLVPLEDLDLRKMRSASYESFRLPLEDRILVQQALHRLSRLQRQVVYALFFRGMTQDEVARETGLSQRKVSRVLHKSLVAMAKNILGTGS